MKSEDILKVVFSKFQNGDGPTKICRDLCGGLSGQKMVQDDQGKRCYSAAQIFRSSTHYPNIRYDSKGYKSDESNEKSVYSETVQ